jgi:deoxyribonuclease-4
MLGSLEDTLSFSKQIPGVEPCMDFAHLHARAGNGSMNSEEEWDVALDQYAGVLGENALKHMHIHLSGIEYSEKGEKNHLKLAESDLDLHGLFSALHKKGCAGRILCESPAMEDDALYMRNLWLEWFG